MFRFRCMYYECMIMLDIYIMNHVLYNIHMFRLCVMTITTHIICYHTHHVVLYLTAGPTSREGM